MRALGLLLLFAVGASADALETGRAQAAQLVVGDLEDLADWCSKNGLAGERDRIYESILQLDPDHARARKGLRYERDKEGAWVRKRSYRAPRNRSQKTWPEFEQDRKSVV